MVAHRLVLVVVAAALIATGLVGCDRGSGEQADALPTSPDARAERFATLQTSLVSEESRADGRTLVSSLERPRVAEEGRVRGEETQLRDAHVLRLINDDVVPGRTLF